MSRRGKERRELVRTQDPAVSTQTPPIEQRPPRGELPVSDKVYQACPYDGCGSTRSRLIATQPGDDGRMERRRCKACLRDFLVWDPRYRAGS